jgi:hypothetical protein
VIAVIVAVIAAAATIGSVIVAAHFNKRDHKRGYDLLQSIDTRVIKLDEKFDNHVALPADAAHRK